MPPVLTVGKARKSQTVSTYGIGSMVDLPPGSFMPLGLDFIERQTRGSFLGTVIHEPRLQRLLGKSHFREAIIPRERDISNYGRSVEHAYTLPTIRFPDWLECPQCHHIGKAGDIFEFGPDHRVNCLACRTTVNPVRFVVACRRGHIQDFPWEWWAHSRKKEGICKSPRLYLLSHGRSASLGDLYVRCTTCGAQRSLETIFSRDALKGIKCSGYRPWLMDHETCEQPLVTIQRGASNIHFPVIASMISIPPASEALGQLLETLWDVLRNEVSKYVDSENNALDSMLEGLVSSHGIDLQLAKSWLVRRYQIEYSQGTDEERSARYEEYEALSRDYESEEVSGFIPQFENKIFEPPDGLKPWFDLIGAVKRLREVRAYCGFSRVDPYPLSIEGIPEALNEGHISPLSKHDKTWLPAVEVRGEGIFIRINNIKMKEWIKGNSEVVERARLIDRIFAGNFEKKGYKVSYHITPSLLLVHSLAHILIRRFSLDCGYSSSSLRERLYVSDEADYSMCGLLIYTASTDSDGSLGGLVNLAVPEDIESIIKGAISDAQWCGNDPVCIESNPMYTGERISGACCHNCLLLPETACEKFNRELDRAMLVGSADHKIKGYLDGIV